MKPRVTIATGRGGDPILRMIGVADQELLRRWKNANRFAFFHRELISQEGQLAWFAGYGVRENDFMFVVDAGEAAIGCMGIRFVGSAWDVYNVILGDPRFKGKGLMARALLMMCGYARGIQLAPVTAKVLAENPALSWYLKVGFAVTDTRSTYVEIEMRDEPAADITADDLRVRPF